MIRPLRVSSVVLAAIVVLCTSCESQRPSPDSGPGADGDGDVSLGDIRHGTDGDASVPGIEDLAAIPNPSNPLSYYVEWETEENAKTKLVVRCGDDWKQTYQSDELTTRHSVFVMGLWDGAMCKFEASVPGGVGAHATETVTVKVGPILEDLPAMNVLVRKTGKMREGWTLVNLTNAFERYPLVVALVDERGRYRWYHQLSTKDPGADTDVRTLGDDRILVGGNRGMMGPRLLDWEGDLVWKEGVDSVRMHHDIRSTDGGKFFYWVGNAEECSGGSYKSDAIVKYDRMEETIVERRPFCDYFQPPGNNPNNDWDHVNTLEFFPDGESVLVSARNVHTLFKINLAEDKLEWKLGLHGDFGLPEKQRFYRQHAPELLSNGNILLYDNGSYRKSRNRRYSRAVEYTFDSDKMTAEEVWSYRPDDPIFTPIWGDADRLDNGNTLVTFGYRNRKNHSRLQEVTRSKEKVWDVELPITWGWYRAERVTELPTGYVE